MKRNLLFIFLLLFSSLLQAQDNSWFEWDELPPLPPADGQDVQAGLAGAFSGVHNEALIVAGGANFPYKMYWNGGEKRTWSDVYVLPSGAEEWLVSDRFKLPESLAYGVSVTTSKGIICVGGIGTNGVVNTCMLLQWNPSDQSITFDSLPSLPVPLAYATGAVANNTLFIAGGISSAQNMTSGKHFFALDLVNPTAWQELPTWDGKGTMVATSGAQSNGASTNFYLIGGRFVENGEIRESLRATHCYNTASKTWSRKADLPVPVIAAPAISHGSNHILVYGGADGQITSRLTTYGEQIKSLQAALKEAKLDTTGTSDPANLQTELEVVYENRANLLNNHPGFSSDILGYHTITNTWAKIGELPVPGVIVTNAIEWNGTIVIPSGEISHGVRTNKIWRSDALSAHDFGVIDYAVILFYLLLLVFSAYFFAKRGTSTDDYFKAGGRVPWWAAGLSIFGTTLSAITFMAVPAKTFATDWLYLMSSMSQILVAPLIVYLFLPFYRRLNITSAYEYLERRFSLLLRLAGGLSFLLFQFGRIGIVLLLPAITLSVVTGINIELCIIVMAALSIIYTVLGGIEAVIWTDVLQVVVLMGGALVVLGTVIFSTEGAIAGVIETAAAQSKLHVFEFDFDFTTPSFWVVLGGGFAGQLIAHSSDQTIVQRYMTTKDEKSAAKSVWTNALISIPAVLLFFFLGTALFVFYQANPEALNPVAENTDSILPWYIVSQLPQGMAGLLVAGIFAASMSSLDSSMNSSATVVTVDFYKRFRPGKEDTSYLKTAKYVTVIVGIAGTLFALLMASFEIQSLWDDFAKILGLFAGGLAGLFLLGMLSSRAHSLGATVGFVASALVQYIVSQHTEIHFLLYTFTGVVSCFVVGFIASILLPGKPKDEDGLSRRTIEKLK